MWWSMRMCEWLIQSPKSSHPETVQIPPRLIEMVTLSGFWGGGFVTYRYYVVSILVVVRLVLAHLASEQLGISTIRPAEVHARRRDGRWGCVGFCFFRILKSVCDSHTETSHCDECTRDENEMKTWEDSSQETVHIVTNALGMGKYNKWKNEEMHEETHSSCWQP